MSPPRTRRLISLTDADVYLREAGPPDGKPFLLLHGFLTSSFTWRHVYPALAQEHRVLMVDLPGSGHSPDPRATDWSAQRCVRLLDELLDALDIPAATVVGSQMGGSLAAWFAALYRSRVERLVVMAAGALGETTTNLGLYRVLANPAAGPWLARYFPRAAFERRWLAAHGPDHQPEPSATTYYFRQLRARGSAIARVGLGVRRSYGPDFDALAGPIRGLDVPALLLFGASDPLVPLATGRRFENLLADARLVTIPGCGDFPQEECPELVATEILQFCGREGSAGRIERKRHDHLQSTEDW
jgi:pimeloyl-ACP methyl ester carboxylesterase